VAGARFRRTDRRDPWWDLDGRSVRRRRAMRRVMALVVLAAASVALAVVLLRPSAARAAGTGVNLDQWATFEPTWQNGNLNGNNTAYPEGGIVPFRLAVEGLKPGRHSIHINYDFTAGGHKAYDFLATWNAWTRPNICAPGGGGVSSMCPGLPVPHRMDFPADPYVADGLSVNQAIAYSGASRKLTIWGGTIVSISRPVHAGSPAGNSTADMRVTFDSTGSAVLFAWGGHLAQSRFWNLAGGGARDGAGEVSGAPWHMRTLQLDGSGNKNQDRSIQPSAIVGELPPFALAPPTSAPPPTPRPQAPQPGTNPPGTNPGPGAPGAPAIPPGVTLTPPPTATAARPVPDAAAGVGVAVGLTVLATSAGLASLALIRRGAPRVTRRP
jgi:hypothetical protein